MSSRKECIKNYINTLKIMSPIFYDYINLSYSSDINKEYFDDISILKKYNSNLYTYISSLIYDDVCYIPGYYKKISIKGNRKTNANGLDDISINEYLTKTNATTTSNIFSKIDTFNKTNTINKNESFNTTIIFNKTNTYDTTNVFYKEEKETININGLDDISINENVITEKNTTVIENKYSGYLKNNWVNEKKEINKIDDLYDNLTSEYIMDIKKNNADNINDEIKNVEEDDILLINNINFMNDDDIVSEIENINTEDDILLYLHDINEVNISEINALNKNLSKEENLNKTNENNIEKIKTNENKKEKIKTHINKKLTKTHVNIKKKRKIGQKNHSYTQKIILKEWYFKNKNNPYPNENVKLELMNKTGLSRKQIDDWFINKRRRTND